MPTGVIRFSGPRLLLVEGVEDIHFFKRLIRERALPQFKILHSGLNTPQGGNSLFAAALSVLKRNVPSFNAVRHVVIVSDADEDAARSFERIRSSLDARGHGPPAQPFQRTAGHPTIEVVMLPHGGGPGNLESICVPLARAANAQVATQVDYFAANVHADQWRPEEQAKMWLRAYLAAACRRDPFVPLGVSFDKAIHRPLMDFAHSSIDDLANILEGYR